MSVTAGVSDTVIAVRDKLRGKIWKTKVRRYWPVIVVRDKLRGNIGKTEVKRYWPGKAPEWAYDADEMGILGCSQLLHWRKLSPLRNMMLLEKIILDSAVWLRAGLIIGTMLELIIGVSGKLRLFQQLKRNPRGRKEDEEESEYDTDSEKKLTGMVMLKPVFVPNSERYPIAELLQLEAEERALEESRKKNLEEKKRETKQIVVEEIRKGLEQEANIADIDTDDEVNEAEDYEAWKAREIARIKSDRDDWEAMLKEKEEIEKVTNMTEEERRERERKHPKAAPRRKQKWRFMQKYYHKGALFQSEADDYAATVGTDGIYTRDFSAPTGEDKMNKTILLKVMQVKHFGHSGRTKWTHLANEDTTNWKNPLSSI
ncbi:hypothetical protein L3X38_026308 [Prunus dulcis]|uniref:Micro-fibrillar-associated protein 1 C-terminal domain-containing protein n=1 Tax=Prunus dulcis TaxID=3755 RepID=A0AAD4YJF9_PRUDU|nr:hypothetical protein L3X38_026308 [Prunus dulcis]